MSYDTTALTFDDNKLDRAKIMADVKGAIQHLHRVGYIHNDVNPNYILLPLDGGSSPAILADFDSYLKAGQPAGVKGGTTGFDEWTLSPTEENDWYGWRKTAEYLGLQIGGKEGGLENRELAVQGFGL